MPIKKTVLAVLLCAAPFATMAAATSTGHLDVYYNDSNADGGGSDLDGDGFGIRGAGLISDAAAVYGEYQKNEYDDSGNLEIQQIRAGLAYLFSKSRDLELYGKAEFINYQAEDDLGDDDDNGWGLHGGIAFLPLPALRVFGELGYLDVGDLDGPEYNVGASYTFTSQFSAVANYRVSDLENEDSGDVELSDLQLGVRFSF